MVSKVASSIARFPGQGQKSVSVENNFIGGLKTEFTGLNFPENACTATSNCVFSIIGDVERRGGIDFEDDAVLQPINTSGLAISSYKWRNAGGDGQTEILVQQVGAILYFYQSSAATADNPLSSQLLLSQVNINTFLVSGSPNNPALVECTYADGNGFLFVFHPYCESFSCTFSSGIITPSQITIRVRDFNGIPDGLGIGPSSDPTAITTRPQTISNEHLYNLLNQGWTNSASFSVNQLGVFPVNFVQSSLGTTISLKTGSQNFTVQAGVLALGSVGSGIPCTVNFACAFQNVNLTPGLVTLSAVGNITAYNSTTGAITVAISSSTVFNSAITINGLGALSNSNIVFKSTNASNTIGTTSAGWLHTVGLYPSNSDIWFEYKDATGTFDPSLAINNSIVQASTPAPQGHFIYNAFNINPTLTSNISGLTSLSTNNRCSTGAWFAGRVWFTGVNASQAPTGDQPYYTWTENIYFSQVITTSDQFGYCFQVNDPTNENLFDVLPTDGGVITIPGTGAIYKLFPVTNGLLVFAQNGVWLITGSQGLGFIATDFSINKVSNVQSISNTAFVNVLGMPVFWNLEGIYMVSPNKENAPYTFGGMKVEPITVGTILTFYNNIPLDSKRYARGDYDPISYVLQWTYRSTQESGISNRYSFDSALCLNVHNKAFYPYTFAASGTCSINGIVFVTYPNSSNGLTPQFKYLTTVGSKTTFSEENNFNNYVDWFTNDGVGVNYTSSFTTGYKLHGQGYRRWKPIYLYMYLRNTTASSYSIQAIWDFATTSIGRESIVQSVTTFTPKFGMLFRRHKLRGHGHAMQFQVSSVSGKPFDIMGWAIPEASNVGA